MIFRNKHLLYKTIAFLVLRRLIQLCHLLPVTFQALAAKANNDLPNCTDRYFDTMRGTLLTRTDDACIKNAPIYGECPNAKSTIDVTTDKHGASAEVILGGTPDAIYPITATCTDPKCSSLILQRSLLFSCNRSQQFFSM